MAEPATPERIERALIAVAVIMETHPLGDRAALLFERLERELAAARAREAPRHRARRLLERLALDHGEARLTLEGTS